MSKSNIKYILFLVAIIVILFICSIGIVLLFKDGGNGKSVPNDKDVSFVSDSNTIIIKNIISVSDVFGKKIEEENGGAFGYLKFDVVNNTSKDKKYQIFIKKKVPTTKEINPSYVTFYLTDEKNNAMDNYLGNKLPSYDDLKYIEDKADCKSIFNGTLKKNEKKHFILRVWIAENFIVADDEESFSFEIGARAV